MAYSFLVNQAPANGSVATFNLKTALKAAGWTVVSSGDGTTYFAASDGITTSASGAGGMANTQAWFVIRDPNGRSWCFQRGTTNVLWRVKYSKSAGFITGGTALLVPSAADEVVLFGSGSNAVPVGATWYSSDNTYKQHIGCGGAAEGYTFYQACMLNTTGSMATIGGAAFQDKLTAGTYSAADTDPYVVNITGTSVNAYDGNFFREGSGGSNCRGLLGASIQQLSGLVFEDYNGNTRIPGGMGVNPFDAKDDLIPLFYARYTATVGFKGVSSMIRWGSAHRAPGDVSTNKDYIYFGAASTSGGVWLPWDGVTTPIL